MNKLFSATLVAATALAFAPAAAHADPPGAAGFTCGFSSTDDPTGQVVNPGTQVGEIDGGPFVVADLPDPADPTAFDVTGNPATGVITCALQVNGTGAFADADAVTVSSQLFNTVVVYLPPTAISYAAGPLDNVYECTTWTLTDAHGDTETLYYDDVSGEFQTDSTLATCSLAISAGP